MPEESIIIKETTRKGGATQISAGTLEATTGLEELVNAQQSGKKPRRKADPYILGIYLVLVVISIIEIFSASSTEIRADNIYGPLKRHAVFLLLGGALVYALQKLHYAYLRQFAWVLGIGSLGLLVISSFFGATINGAQRAIMIGSFTIQPAEIVKYSVVLLLAAILGNHQKERGASTWGVIEAAVIVVVFSGLLWMNGLTNMILLMGVSMAMFLIGNIEWRKFLTVVLVYAFCGGVLIYFKYQDHGATEFDKATMEMEASVNPEKTRDGSFRTGTHINRMLSYRKGVNPEDKITDENRQVWFAIMAQAHGGIIGKGPGNSRESARLPLAFSDYIFSIIVEDSGLVGGIVLLILYLGLLARAGVVAYRLRKAFPTFLIMGCALMIVFQALVHMAIVTGLFPVSGQPLPFISKGGTSIIVMSIAIGSMLSVSRFAIYRDEDISESGTRKKRARKAVKAEEEKAAGIEIVTS